MLECAHLLACICVCSQQLLPGAAVQLFVLQQCRITTMHGQGIRVNISVVPCGGAY